MATPSAAQSRDAAERARKRREQGRTVAANRAQNRKSQPTAVAGSTVTGSTSGPPGGPQAPNNPRSISGGQVSSAPGTQTVSSSAGGTKTSQPLDTAPPPNFVQQLLMGIFGGGGGTFGGQGGSQSGPGRNLQGEFDVDEGTSRFLTPAQNAEVRRKNLESQGAINVGAPGNAVTQEDIDKEQEQTAADKFAANAPTIRSIDRTTGQPIVLEGVQQDRVEQVLQRSADGSFDPNITNRVSVIRNPENVDEFRFNINAEPDVNRTRLDQAAALAGGMQNLFEQSGGNIQNALEFAPPAIPQGNQLPQGQGLDPGLGMSDLLGVLGLGFDDGFGPSEGARGDIPIESQPLAAASPTGDAGFASASAPIVQGGGGGGGQGNILALLSQLLGGGGGGGGGGAFG